MSRARVIADYAKQTTDLATQAELDAIKVSGEAHIIPGVLYPAYRGLLAGNTTGRTFVDSGGTGHAIGASGKARVSHTAGLKKIGNSSLRFDGYDGEFLTIADHADFDRDTGGDFTWEMWVNIDGYQTNYTTLLGSLDSDVRMTIGPDSSTPPKFSVYGPWGSHLTTTTTLSLFTWHHFAYVRDSGTIRLYVNGVQEATLSNTSDIDPDLIRIGQYTNTTLFFKGNLDEIRFSDNARYTSGTTFTPSTTAFSSDGNTKLLIHSNETLAHSGTYGTAQSDGFSYYYTDIKGSKSIKDPRIGGHFGSHRHKVRSLQKLKQETATHADDVYSVDGREWMRYVGGDGTDVFNDSAGNGVHMTNAGDSLEITGYFNDMNLSMYSGSSYDAYTLYIDGGVGASKTNPAGVASPLASRFVDPSSVVNVGLGATLGIHTVKIAKEGDSLYFYNIDLIAQDTSSDANKVKIQIPSQNVVSYGKKFTVSGTPHYDPFNGMSGAKTLTQLGDYIDTATSLGMDNWKAGTSNYYKPFNGGRVVKWVDTSGTIKTSVTMMPPNAQNFASQAVDAYSDGEVQAGTNNHAITFNTSAVDYSLSELAKSFHWREFGNGGANGTGGLGTSLTYADFSMLTTNADYVAYAMDDGLTSMQGEVNGDDGNNGNWYAGGGNSVWITFIGTGIGFQDDKIGTSAEIANGTYAQNLAYGSHILRLERSSPYDVWVDGFHISDAALVSTDFIGGKFIDFHQPKMPPIPVDCVVIADYMLMADFVLQNGHNTAHDTKCSKGVRFQSHSRDVHYNDQTSVSGNIYDDGSWPGMGYRTSGNSSSGQTANKYSIPAFGTTFIAEGFDGDDRNDCFIDDSDVAQDTNSTNNNVHGDIVTPNSAVVLGQHKFAVHGISGGASSPYLSRIGFHIVTPIHTSSHYQFFESPLLKELIGGDRNMEQTNLVVTPDGKSWDQVTRDTSYIGNKVLNVNSNTSYAAGAVVIFDDTRGNHRHPASNWYNKDFAIANNRFICLVDGEYQIYCISNSDQAVGPEIILGRGNSEWGMVAAGYDESSPSIVCNLSRGDFVKIEGHWDGNHDRNQFWIVRLS